MGRNEDVIQYGDQSIALTEVTHRWTENIDSPPRGARRDPRKKYLTGNVIYYK